MSTRLVVWLLLALLAGCATPPQRSPVNALPAIPAHWAGAAQVDGLVAENWVAALGDPALDSLVREALSGNFDLSAVAARVQAARAQARIDGALRWPQLGFGAGYQRSQVRDSGYGSTEYGAFEAVFDFACEVDVWGRIAAGQRAAQQEAQAAEADFRAARLSLAARVAQAWFELTEARLQVAVSEQSIHDRRTLVDLVRGRFARGLTRGLDLRLALTDLANAEAQLATARNRAQAMGRRLEILLGRYPANAVLAPVGLPEPPATLAAGLPAELLARRPDMVAAWVRLGSADARLENAQKALLPRITLTGSGGTRSAALTDLADPRSAAWNLAMGLIQPVFTGGRLRGGIALQQARVEEAFKLYQSAALNAFREVEQALAAEESLRAQETAQREAVAQT